MTIPHRTHDAYTHMHVSPEFSTLAAAVENSPFVSTRNSDSWMAAKQINGFHQQRDMENTCVMGTRNGSRKLFALSGDFQEAVSAL